MSAAAARWRASTRSRIATTSKPNEQVDPGNVLDARRRCGTAAAPEVSIEESIHERFNINVGDEMRFDVLGRPLPRG